MISATYSDDEMEIVRNGIDAIRNAFQTRDEQGKLNLLFCLDRYLDPWFGYKLPYANDIFCLLEWVVISDESFEVAEDAMDLIMQYGTIPCEILEQHFDNIPENLQNDARICINEGKGVYYMEINLNDLDKYFLKSELIPAIAVDVNTKKVLMLAYMNKESLQKTLETGYTWYWSRSRQELWNKGATSGHLQKVISIFADCDNDTLLLNVEQTGSACHTGHYSCFFTQIYGKPEVIE